MDPSTILRDALALHRRGQFHAAVPLYEAVLAAHPRHVDALHLLGVAKRQLGDAQSAVDRISAALAVDAGQAIIHCNLGAALQDLGRAADALAAYDRALALDPGYAMAHANRGNALRHLGRLPEALDSYDHALALRHDYPEAWCNRGAALHAMERHQDAVDSFSRAIKSRPGYAEAWCGQGAALQSLGDHERAFDCYQRALAAEPGHAATLVNLASLMQRLHRHEDALAFADDAVRSASSSAGAHLRRGNALHALGRDAEAAQAFRTARELGADPGITSYMLAALGEGAAPAAPPRQYVEALFDQYAPHFDEHLQQVLGYATPAVLAAALAPHLRPGAAILDAGCGTGLCAPHLRPFAARLVGVDLSANMLAEAARTDAYDCLERAELCDFLARSAGEFDAINAADVLVYFGDLAPLFRVAAGALRPHGLFAFSVEEGAGADFELRGSGRYAHSRACLAELAAAHGFDCLHLSPQALRRDREGEVAGLVVVLRRA